MRPRRWPGGSAGVSKISWCCAAVLLRQCSYEMRVHELYTSAAVGLVLSLAVDAAVQSRRRRRFTIEKHCNNRTTASKREGDLCLCRLMVIGIFD